MVIILSGALAVFLVLGIVALVKLIQLLNHLKRIAQKAEELTDKAEAVGEFLQRSVSSLALVRLLKNVRKVLVKHQSKSGKGE